MDEGLNITVDARLERPIRLAVVHDGEIVERREFATLDEFREWEAVNPPKEDEQ
jgi:hypothetical protein